MCRHMQRVRWQRDRRLTPSRNCEKRRRPVRTCIYTTLKPVHNSFGEVNRTDTTCDSFHPAFNTQVTEGKKIQQRFYILIWSVNCSWDMEDEIIFIGKPVWDMDRFSLMSLSIQSFEKCISKGLHKIFCMFLSAINLNVKGYFKCSLESHWSTGKKNVHSFSQGILFNLNQDINTSDLISAWLLFSWTDEPVKQSGNGVHLSALLTHMKSDTPGFLKLDIYIQYDKDFNVTGLSMKRNSLLALWTCLE